MLDINAIQEKIRALGREYMVHDPQIDEIIYALDDIKLQLQQQQANDSEPLIMVQEASL